MPNRQDRIRIGLLLPSSNTTQEAEFNRILPDTVSLHVTRLPLRNVDPAPTARNVEDIETESQKLADADVDAIVLAATAPSSRNGIGYDQELIRRIESASNRRATTASTALIEALKTLELQRIVMAGPWSEATNVTSAQFIEASGFTVIAHQALGHVNNLDIGLLDAQTAYDLGRKLDRPDAQAVMLACGNWLTLGIVDELEKTIGKPVLTTNQVSLWAVLRLAGYHKPIAGWGKLLTHHMDAP
jgi:maleate isomerase